MDWDLDMRMILTLLKNCGKASVATEQKDQIPEVTKGLVGHVKEFGNYTEDSWDLLKGFDLDNVTWWSLDFKKSMLTAAVWK